MNKIKQILKSKFRTGLKTLPYLLISIFVGVTAVYATPGSKLTPPGAVSNTMYSLTDIYELATNSTQATLGSGEIEETPTLGETGVTLTQVYDAVASALENAGTTAPTFASSDQTTYSCEALATDPTQPAVTLETICGYHSADGCSWSGSACTGGTKTPTDGYMTWYAGTASCLEKSDEGSSSWRLPTTPELVTHYFENNIDGNPPTGFAFDYYWSGTTHQYPGYEGGAYYVSMSGGDTSNDGKSNPNYLVHCAH